MVQRLKRRTPVGVERDDLAVEHRRVGAHAGDAAHRRILPRDVLQVSRRERDDRAVLDGLRAIAVPLHLVRPLGARRQRAGGHRHHRGDARGGTRNRTPRPTRRTSTEPYRLRSPRAPSGRLRSPPIQRREQRVELLAQLQQPGAIDGDRRRWTPVRRAARADRRRRRVGEQAIERLLDVDDPRAQIVVRGRHRRGARTRPAPAVDGSGRSAADAVDVAACALERAQERARLGRRRDLALARIVRGVAPAP